MVALWCEACTQFQDKLVRMCNYRSSFILGSTNVRSSTFKEHAATDMHARAMSLYRKQHSSSVFEYALIARALTNLAMDDKSLTWKFEVAYLIAKEKIAFSKMQPLEERHGVDLGPGYGNDHACSTLIEFIACDLTTADHPNQFSLQIFLFANRY